MSPIANSIHHARATATVVSLAARADSTATATATATAVPFGTQFAWPPNSTSMPFWVAIFIICPVILIAVGWGVWECKFGSDGDDDVRRALREKRKEANKKPPKIKASQIKASQIKVSQISRPAPVAKR